MGSVWKKIIPIVCPFMHGDVAYEGDTFQIKVIKDGQVFAEVAVNAVKPGTLCAVL